jgi:antitoxin (DNA-binding transcriptional repressor) of toxin-antitoxin stability system
VIRTIDGPLAPIACASRTAYQPCRDCSDVKTCNVRLMMTKVRDAISDVLDRVTLADMIATGGGRTMARVKPVRKSQALSKVSGTAKAAKAFSSEVDTGSREENASKQQSRAPFRFYRNGKGSRKSRG